MIKYQLSNFTIALNNCGMERKGFATAEYDGESDYYSMGIRMYSAEFGRFLAVDPLFEVKPRYTPYHYGFNSPLVYCDPSGLVPEKEKNGEKLQTLYADWGSAHEYYLQHSEEVDRYNSNWFSWGIWTNHEYSIMNPEYATSSIGPTGGGRGGSTGGAWITLGNPFGEKTDYPFIGYHARKMEIDSFKCYVGGLPKERVLPFQYKAPFSPIDVIEEYTREARYVEDGKIVVKQAMTDREYLNFDEIGTLEAFNSDGLRSIIKTVNAPNMIEKTLRYPGHIENIILLRDMGLFSNEPVVINGNEVKPIDLTSKVLIDKWKLTENDEEFTVMQIIISGMEDGKKITYKYDLLDRTDLVNRISSMARTTGYTATAAVNMFADGLFSQKGVFPPENIAVKQEIYDYIFGYLEERNVNYKLSIITD